MTAILHNRAMHTTASELVDVLLGAQSAVPTRAHSAIVLATVSVVTVVVVTSPGVVR